MKNSAPYLLIERLLHKSCLIFLISRELVCFRGEGNLRLSWWKCCLMSMPVQRTLFCDPFVGSGTTLFKSARKGLACYAAEINPSAIEMAKTINFVHVSSGKRLQYLAEAEGRVRALMNGRIGGLFSHQHESQARQDQSIDADICTAISRCRDQPLAYNILVNVLMRFQSFNKPNSPSALLVALNEHRAIVRDLPSSDAPYLLFHTHARCVPVQNNSVDLVITSPPYINVFNYHQYNRPAIETLGWDLLGVARSEIGSNSQKQTESLSHGRSVCHGDATGSYRVRAHHASSRTCHCCCG